MLSPALSELLERARTCFGLEVEILDAALGHVFPEGGSDLRRLLHDAPELRRTLLDGLAHGRPQQIEHGGVAYEIFPLRQPPAERQPSGLLAVRRVPRRRTPDPRDAEPWSELARAIVEADLASVDALNHERQRSRRLLATLHFVNHLAATIGEADLAQATVQAAAIWFDVDARIYQRDLAGDFVLRARLPGSPLEEGPQLLNSAWIGKTGEVTRIAADTDWLSGAIAREIVVVPLAADGDPDWVLAIAGDIAEEAEPLLRSVGAVVGRQLESMRARRRESARERLESALLQPGAALELAALRLVRELVDVSGAESGALTLNQRGRLRRLARVGSIAPETVAEAAASGEWLFSPDQFVCGLPLGDQTSATLELRPPQGRPFDLDAAMATRSAGRVLRTWLAGAVHSLTEAPVARAFEQASLPSFVHRLEEELERARRFDLQLSLVLVEVAALQSAAEDLEKALRRELRGSDVLGALNGHRVAALLTHTDAEGLQYVVRRLRQKLADAAGTLQWSSVLLGQAAFSPDCRTANALVSRALRDAEAIVVH